MAHIPFGWVPMDPAIAAAQNTTLPPTFPIAAANGTMYYLDPALYASFASPGKQPVAPIAIDVARQRQEEENASIHLVHLLVTCTNAIQAGNYSTAHDNLAKARKILEVITTSTGIGRVANHFANALSQRLFPAYSHMLMADLPPIAPIDLHNHFYDAGPYLKFAYSTANQAILDAFEGCDNVHIVDFALMEGLQWPPLIHALSKRDGGPPHLRITGIGPHPTSGGDKLNEVGIRLTDLAISLHIPFSFHALYADQLNEVNYWMLKLVPGEALAFNSILQLHRLLIDPDADLEVPAPIDTLLHWVSNLQPKIFTVVEQEAEHNRPSLLERFTNALFHYASMFDSMEEMSHHAAGGSTTNTLAEEYLRSEIFDVVCGEGSARTERHELLGCWRERLLHAGLVQVPFGPNEVRLATAQLIHATSFSGSGYTILECAGSLALAWHDRPLYVATAWRANTAGATANTERYDLGRRGRNGSDKGKKPAIGHGDAGGIVMM